MCRVAGQRIAEVVMMKLVLEAHGTGMLGGGWFVTFFLRPLWPQALA